MRNFIIILLFFPALIFAQEKIEISHLSKAINTVGAELNFFQNEKEQAFFTAIREENDDFISSIYSTEFQLGEWSKGKYFEVFNSDNFESGNIFITKDKEAFFTFCANEKCAIYQSHFKKERWTTPKRLDERINKTPSTSSQPTIAETDAG